MLSEKKSKTDPIIKLIYIPRIIGYLFTFAMVGSYFFYQKEPPLLWILLFLQCFLWPHIAYLISSNVPNPRKSEFLLLTIDSFFFGLWIATTNYNPWILITLLTSTAAGNMVLEGFLFSFRCILSLILGALIAGYFHGYKEVMFTPNITMIIAMIFIIVYISNIGFLFFKRSIKLLDTNLKLKKGNQEIKKIAKIVKTASSSLNGDEAIQAILSLLQETIAFDFATLHLINKEKKGVHLHAVYGNNVSQDDTHLMKSISVSLKELPDKYFELLKKQGYELKNVVTSTAPLVGIEKNIYLIKPYSSCLTIPLTSEEEVEGSISFFSEKQALELQASDPNILTQAATQISLLLKNDTLYKAIKQHQKELKNKQLELEKLSEKISFYLAPGVFHSIFEEKREVKIESSRKRLTIFFSDIAGFSSLTDTIGYDTLATILSEYLNHMTDIVRKYNGTIDKFIGDAILVFFGSPKTKGVKQDAIECVLMAIEMQQSLQKLYTQWEKYNVQNLINLRIGINSGFCTIGNFGSNYRMDYTIIGGQVNLASRLQTSAKPGEIIISEDTYLLVKNNIACQKAAKVHVKGILRSIQTYKVTGVINGKEHSERVK